MNPVYDFSAVDHAVMLGDQVRLEAYHRAILNQVKQGMVVAEIGTGTGILSAYAASQTKGPVYGIEYYENTANMARAMMKAAKLDHVQIIHGESYSVTLSPQPEILITETIGAIGPEEHTVELCYDFKKRHPELKSIIPSRLKVCAEPIRSQKAGGHEQEFYDYYSSASFGAFDYDLVRPELEKIWCSAVRYIALSDAETVGKVSVLADYELGVTEHSAFSKVIDLSHLPEATAVHLYFEAVLDKDVLLSTHYSEPITHWGNAYVTRPIGASKLTVSYERTIGHLEVFWDK